MDLRTYLFKNKKKIADFARQINYHPNFINGIATGRLKAGVKCAKIIEEATNGEVTAMEVISEKSPKLCPHCKGIL